jgi:protein TonB
MPGNTDSEGKGAPVASEVRGIEARPTMDHDSPPRTIRVTAPCFPSEAFAKGVEGTVMVEILIDTEGGVVRAKVIQSVPLLDAAALETVYQWTFQPAMKDDRPVPATIHVPIAFRKYREQGPSTQEQRRQRP